VTRGCLYCYYRADPAQIKALRNAVDALFRAVSENFSVQGRWLQRRDDPATCMEIYADVANVDALGQFLRQECERSGFRRLLADAGVRHDEVFVDAN
jgi:hypothetical protein